MSESLNLLIVGEENDLYESIKEVLQDLEMVLISPYKLKTEIQRYDPDLVLILHNAENSPIDTLHLIQNEFSDLNVIYVHYQQDFQLLREIIRVGAADFLVIPDETNLLTERIQTLARKEERKANQVNVGGFRRGRGQVIGFYSGKGGSGKTFLSTAFAQTLKLESTAQVIYIDLNLQYGGAETFLGIETTRSLIDLKSVIHEINENHIRNVTEKEPHSKLELLISPRDAELAEHIDEEYIIRLLRACRRSYDFIIIDLPSVMDENTYTVLEESDRIFYVMSLDTPSIRVFKYVDEVFNRLGVQTNERLEIIINEVGRENELTKKDLERFIDYPITAQIRRDIKGVQAAVNQGQPIRKEPKEKKLVLAAKDVQKWVTSMLK